MSGCAGDLLSLPPVGGKPGRLSPDGRIITSSLPPLGQGVPVQVAILAPLSGPAGQTGQAIIHAAQLALFDMKSAGASLRPYDTGGTPQGTLEAAQQAISEGASVIIGPLFSSGAKALSGYVRAAGIPALTLTTDPSAADTYVYVAGFLIRDQAERVVDYAVRQGLRRFAILSTDTPFGRAMSTEYERAVAGVGGLLSNTLLRTPGEDASEHVRILTSFDARVAEHERLVEDLEARLERGKDVQASRELTALQITETAGPLPFDALLMTSVGSALLEDLALLASVDVTSSSVRFIGPMLWNEPPWKTEPALAGAWYPASPPAPQRRFVERYTEVFDAPPVSQIASLGYDLTALAIKLPTDAGRVYGAYSRDALTSPSGFQGWDGLFRFRTDGTVERSLAVMEIQPDGPKLLEAASASFGSSQDLQVQKEEGQIQEDQGQDESALERDSLFLHRIQQRRNV